MESPSPSAPLTTTFSPPASCFNDIYQVLTSHSTLTSTLTEPISLTTYQYFQLGPPTPTECFPSPGPQPWTALDIPTDAYYSPAICPSGYFSCSISETSVGPLTETHATCCPNDFTCQANTRINWYRNHKCTRDITDGEPKVYTIFDPNGATPQTKTATISGSYGLNAYGLSIRRMNTDTSFFIPTQTPTPTGPSASAITTDSPSNPPSSSTSPSPGLSPGAKAGIGVGVGVAALLLIVIGLLVYRMFLRKREGGWGGRRSKSHQTMAEMPMEPYRFQRGDEAESKAAFGKVDSRNSQPAELWSETRPELEG
ncbi:hypothetical protein FQN52_008253 [Onygenales sp. PD_12]|nr:hypothetical protein FQN52_008253 [Onygenales sp. PD_12]